jgi:hypothetical protein
MHVHMVFAIDPHQDKFAIEAASDVKCASLYAMRKYVKESLDFFLLYEGYPNMILWPRSRT